MVPPDSHRITRVLWYSGYKTGGACVFVYGAITRYGPAFQQCSTNTTLCNSLAGLWPCQSCPTTIQAATPIRLHHSNFGLFPVRSPLLRESLLISLPPGTEMFHFPGYALPTLCIQVGVTWLHHAGLPHSEIFGSTLARSSPKLIAAGHVLHRRLMPRHPPYALIRLTVHLLLRCTIQRFRSITEITTSLFASLSLSCQRTACSVGTRGRALSRKPFTVSHQKSHLKWWR